LNCREQLEYLHLYLFHIRAFSNWKGRHLLQQYLSFAYGSGSASCPDTAGCDELGQVYNSAVLAILSLLAGMPAGAYLGRLFTAAQFNRILLTILSCRALRLAISALT